MERQALPCRVAILGLDRDTSRLLDATRSTPHVQLAACFDVDMEELGELSTPSADALRRLLADDRFGNDWESLLGDDFVDLVLVARPRETAADRELRSEQLRRLVQAGIPLIVTHPPCEMLLAYELQMIRQDTACPIFPYVPAAIHPGIGLIENQLAREGSPLGRVEQIVCEHHIPESHRAPRAVRASVARDVIVLQQWLGEITAVSATGAEHDGNDWGRLAVHLTSPGDCFGRWSATPARAEPVVEYHIIGSEQSVDVTISGDDTQLKIEAPSGTTGPLDVHDWNPAQTFLTAVLDHLQHGDPPPQPSWDEVCRSLEVVDAVERSLQRRRTIELYHEQVTEQDTFKGMMAAGGCGILLWVLFLLVLAGLVEGLNLPVPSVWLQRTWITLLVLPLLVFLGLQLLQLVFAGDNRPAQREPTHERPTDESMETTG